MVFKEKLKPSSWHIQDTKNYQKHIEIILIFNCEKPPLKLTIFHIYENCFHETWMDLSVKKTETLSGSFFSKSKSK